MQRIEADARRVDQRGVAGLAGEERIDPRKQTIPVPRPASPVPPLDKREPRDPRPRLLELAFILRAVLAPARHGDLGVGPTRHWVERSRVEPQLGPPGVEVKGRVTLTR